MHIGIDIHAMGARLTGNETYIRNLVDQLLAISRPEQRYTLYHTAPIDIGGWDADLHIVKPHNALLRIPFGFPRALKRDAVDLALFQYVAPPVTPCPTVVMVHDISYEFFPEYFNPLSRKRMQLLIPYSARKSAHVLTVSEYSRQQIIAKYGIPESKVSVTYNGVSEKFRKIEDEESINATLARFSLEQPFILAVGNLQPRKNIERLIRVYAEARNKGLIDHDLVLVGQAQWQGHAVFEEIANTGVQHHIHTTGYVSEEELIALYNRADLFVYPSYYEGFGLPVIESMACGTPVITSNVSSLPEVAGEAAILVDPHSDNEIADALVKLCSDQELRNTMVNAGLQQAGKFNWRNTAQQTLQIFDSV